MDAVLSSVSGTPGPHMASYKIESFRSIKLSSTFDGRLSEMPLLKAEVSSQLISRRTQLTGPNQTSYERRGLPASTSPPASERTVCAVGATDKKDARASFSNWSDLIDVFAPGVDVTSTWNNLGTNTISGTSMAAPHIAGLGAYLLSLEGAMSPAALCERIQTLATPRLCLWPCPGIALLAFNGASA